MKKTGSDHLLSHSFFPALIKSGCAIVSLYLQGLVFSGTTVSGLPLTTRSTLASTTRWDFSHEASPCDRTRSAVSLPFLYTVLVACTVRLSHALPHCPVLLHSRRIVSSMNISNSFTCTTCNPAFALVVVHPTLLLVISPHFVTASRSACISPPDAILCALLCVLFIFCPCSLCHVISALCTLYTLHPLRHITVLSTVSVLSFLLLNFPLYSLPPSCYISDLQPASTHSPSRAV